MSKQKEEEKTRKSRSDDGQGSAGHVGTDGDHGSDIASGNDDKSKKKRKNSSPVPIKRQD